MSIKTGFKKLVQNIKDNLKYRHLIEKKLDEATKNDIYNCSTKILQEIADASYKSSEEFNAIMRFLFKKLQSKNKNWRRIYKALNVIEFLIRNGSEKCVQIFIDEIFQIRILQDFWMSEKEQDKGVLIRDKATKIVDILLSEEKIQEFRNQGLVLHDNIIGIDKNDKVDWDSFKEFVHTPKALKSKSFKEPIMSNNENYYIKENLQNKKQNLEDFTFSQKNFSNSLPSINENLDFVTTESQDMQKMRIFTKEQQLRFKNQNISETSKSLEKKSSINQNSDIKKFFDNQMKLKESFRQKLQKNNNTTTSLKNFNNQTINGNVNDKKLAEYFQNEELKFVESQHFPNLNENQKEKEKSQQKTVEECNLLGSVRGAPLVINNVLSFPEKTQELSNTLLEINFNMPEKSKENILPNASLVNSDTKEDASKDFNNDIEINQKTQENSENKGIKVFTETERNLIDLKDLKPIQMETGEKKPFPFDTNKIFSLAAPYNSVPKIENIQLLSTLQAQLFEEMKANKLNE